MAIVIVGGAGYIGSHVVRALERKGHEVVVFDNLEKGHREAVGDTAFVRGDLRRKGDVQRLFEKYEVSAVMHFSAYSIVPESMEKPELYYENNIGGTVNLLAAMHQHGVNSFIFSSTAAVYGEPRRIPLDEDHPTVPTNVYGETKLGVERMLRWFDVVHGIKSVCLRYFNAAGADHTGDIGELHDPETHLIPLVLQAAAGVRESISIYGDDYETRDGTCVRDYIHVTDLADAHIRALEYVQSEVRSDIFNLGNGNGYTVREVIAEAEEVVGKSIPVRMSGRRPGDPAVLVASSEKARRVLGWEPQFPSLHAIIESAWKWHRGAAREWIKKAVQ